MADYNKPPKIYFKPVIRPQEEKYESEIPDVKREIWLEMLSWAKTVVVALLLVITVNSFVIVNAVVPTPSMENTIQTNDRIVAFRMSYLFSEPGRYDMIVFRGPEGDPKLYVKRILGLPGESLTIINGEVFINGSTTPQRSDFVKGGLNGNYGVFNEATGMLEPFIIPEDHFFVLGDFRDRSADSRIWSETYIPRGRILGRVAFRYFPGFSNLRNR